MGNGKWSCGKWEKWTIPKWGIDVGQALGHNGITITLDDDTFWARNFNQRQFKMRFDNDNDYDDDTSMTSSSWQCVANNCNTFSRSAYTQCGRIHCRAYRLHVNSINDSCDFRWHFNEWMRAGVALQWHYSYIITGNIFKQNILRIRNVSSVSCAWENYRLSKTIDSNDVKSDFD